MVTVIVTRPAHQAAPLLAALYAKGISAVSCPTIEILPPLDFGPLDSALGRLASFDWMVFTSANAVQAFFDRAEIVGLPSPLPRAAAIGPATSSALAGLGIAVDVEAPKPVGESLAEALTAHEGFRGSRVLIPRAAEARDVLPRMLSTGGAEVEIAVAYRNVLPNQNRDRLRELLEDPSIVILTSPSTARNFVELVGFQLARSVPVIAVGPITSSTARSFELDVAESLLSFDIDDVVAAVVRTLPGASE